MGTWELHTEKIFETITSAIQIGFRHIDCAPIYGNEAEIGAALEKNMCAGKVLRSEIFVTSKLWNDSHKTEDVEPALRKTLKNLRLDYLDLYLIHWPIAQTKNPAGGSLFLPLSEAPLQETWKEMERMVGLGLVKSIGVSNYSIKKIEEMKKYASIMPAANQVESHPYLQQDELIEYSKNNGIATIAYSPLGRGEKPDKTSTIKLIDDPIIKAVAEKHHATPGQILLAWQIERGLICIPKSSSEKHLKENYEALDIHLDVDDIKEIKKINKNHRYVPGCDFISPENGYTMETLWD